MVSWSSGIRCRFPLSRNSLYVGPIDPELHEDADSTDVITTEDEFLSFLPLCVGMHSETLQRLGTLERSIWVTTHSVGTRKTLWYRKLRVLRYFLFAG